jgi:hypothetical protein
MRRPGPNPDATEGVTMGFQVHALHTGRRAVRRGRIQPASHVGDEVYVSGNRRVKVLAYLPTERISEFVDEPRYGMLEVEPV